MGWIFILNPGTLESTHVTHLKPQPKQLSLELLIYNSRAVKNDTHWWVLHKPIEIPIFLCDRWLPSSQFRSTRISHRNEITKRKIYSAAILKNWKKDRKKAAGSSKLFQKSFFFLVVCGFFPGSIVPEADRCKWARRVNVIWTLHLIVSSNFFY